MARTAVAGVPNEWTPAVEVVSEAVTTAQLDEVSAVLTTCAVAVAETGEPYRVRHRADSSSNANLHETFGTHCPGPRPRRSRQTGRAGRFRATLEISRQRATRPHA